MILILWYLMFSSVDGTIKLMILLYMNLSLTFEERSFYQSQKSWPECQKIHNSVIEEGKSTNQRLNKLS